MHPLVCRSSSGPRRPLEQPGPQRPALAIYPAQRSGPDQSRRGRGPAAVLDERHFIYLLHGARHSRLSCSRTRRSDHQSTSRSVPGDSNRSAALCMHALQMRLRNSVPDVLSPRPPQGLARWRITLHDHGPASCLGREQVTEDVRDTEPSERHGTVPYRSHSLTSLACRRHVKGQLTEPLSEP